MSKTKDEMIAALYNALDDAVCQLDQFASQNEDDYDFERARKNGWEALDECDQFRKQQPQEK